ncbi:MAG: phosphate signaling complex protein PhoU [Oscillospiraceae bacterium]|jgi:phosphate transport system protein|nr:phosphate signaling complex protein PhoU [Oscillospiraceae bacterium]
MCRVKSFLEIQIRKIEIVIADMSLETAKCLSKIVLALNDIDIEIAKEVLSTQEKLKNFDSEAENKYLKIITLQHPVFYDLRYTNACLRIVGDIDRIASQCIDVCEIIKTETIDKDLDVLKKTVGMFKLVLKMYEKSLESFFTCDSEKARKVCVFDDEIDAMFSDIVFNISSFISNDPKKVESCTDLMFITKYAERIADHCANIAEWVIYIDSGVHYNLN